MSDQQELQRLQEEIRQLRAQLADVERRVEALAGSGATVPVAPPVLAQTAQPELRPPEESAVAARVERGGSEAPVEEPRLASAATVMPPVIAAAGTAAATPVASKESFEVRLGTYWLPRIGIAVLLTGMVFLVTWSYQYLGRGGKVGLSYLCCALLGALGLWLEKKTPAFGRVLLAGALALTYFITYALHFVPAFRVIDSVPVALTLLVLVVAAIVIVANRKQSALIAGMALFFGYYTSLVSGVDTFTLAANAVLAAAALFFLARNRWVPLSFGAVLATYLAYMLWVWKINHGRELASLLFDSGYLGAEQFRLRGAFLALYWLLFTAGGLMVNREALPSAECKGLLTLNNGFFLVLFALLMRHAYPDVAWAFYFPFAGALFVTSAIAYQRFAPDRSLLDVLFAQAVLVATLGVLSYFKGDRLVAVLAAESLLILLLAGWMNTPGLRWVARLTFALGAITAWNDYPGWDRALMGSATLAGALGLIGARLEGRASQKSGGLAASYFAALATGLMMSAAGEHFRSSALPWVWPVMAVLIAIVGGVLRTREVVWAAHLPLLWAHLSFYSARIKGREWDLAPALALIAVTFAFGIALWAKRRAENVPERARIASNRILRPYGIVAVIAVIVATIDHTPVEWRLTVFTLESLVFVIAAVLAEETLYVGLAMATLATGAIDYGRIDPVVAPRGVAWVNLLAGIGIGIVSERLFKWRMMSLLFYEKTCRRLRAWMVVIITAVTVYGLAELVGKSVLTVVWAVGGFALLVLGFAGKERSYRFAGLIVLLFSLGRAVVYDLGKLETIYRILTYMGLGVILLVLGFLYTKNREKLAKWL